MKQHRMIEEALDKFRNHSPEARALAWSIADTLWPEHDELDHTRQHVNILVKELKCKFHQK